MCDSAILLARIESWSTLSKEKQSNSLRIIIRVKGMFIRESMHIAFDWFRIYVTMNSYKMISAKSSIRLKFGNTHNRRQNKGTIWMMFAKRINEKYLCETWTWSITINWNIESTGGVVRILHKDRWTLRAVHNRVVLTLWDIAHSSCFRMISRINIDEKIVHYERI